MATFKRTKEPGNELTLKSGSGERRLKKLEKILLDDLDIQELTPTLKLMARRAAELTLVAEELASQLSCGNPISVELMGRNTDRLARAMKELRDQATLVRIKEGNAKAMREMQEFDDEYVPPRAPGPRRERPIRRVIVNGE